MGARRVEFGWGWQGFSGVEAVCLAVGASRSTQPLTGNCAGGELLDRRLISTSIGRIIKYVRSAKASRGDSGIADLRHSSLSLDANFMPPEHSWLF